MCFYGVLLPALWPPSVVTTCSGLLPLRIPAQLPPHLPPLLTVPSPLPPSPLLQIYFCAWVSNGMLGQAQA